MKFKLLFYSFIVSQFFLFYCFSQESDSLKNKAKFYYESEEYQIAIPWFTKNIIINPLDYKSLQYRGNCYLEIGQNDKAIQDYLSAIKLTRSSEILFNLGNAYERSDRVDSAIFYFNKFNEFEPKQSDGSIRLCLIYMYSHPEWGDTAIYYASQAVKKEPGKTINLNFLAMAYYSAGHYNSALETALIGLSIDSSFSLLNQTAGISSFFLRDYPSAISYFDRAFKSNPSDFTLLDYKIQSMLLRNTNAELIYFQSGQRISLKEISIGSLKKTEEKINDRNGNYSYPKLIQKLRFSPLNMSIDEYFMIYLGSCLQSDYSPNNKKMKITTNDYGPVIQAEAFEEALIRNPGDFPLYLNLADFYQEMGNDEKYFENRFKYFGFIESIKASGDGLTPETAFFVNDLSHEYSILVSLGYRPKAQKQVKQKKHNFDVTSVVDQNNKEMEIYFNIDKPLSKPAKIAKN